MSPGHGGQLQHLIQHRQLCQACQQTVLKTAGSQASTSWPVATAAFTDSRKVAIIRA